MMKNKLNLLFILLIASLLLVQCKDDDDNGNALEPETCTDGIQNGDEEGIDCGGSVCPPCDDGGIDFNGTYYQEDILGRPTTNIFFGGSDTSKNNYNISEVSNRAAFQSVFEQEIELYHDMYAVALEIPVDELNYEQNIFDWNINTYTLVLANFDALQVAPNGPTTYYNADTGLAFTGRSLSDDVIDINLTLLFGGEDGSRFDGNNDTPQLTSDGVDAGDRDFNLPFPYLESPNLEE